jgi:hypothetical protein
MMMMVMMIEFASGKTTEQTLRLTSFCLVILAVLLADSERKIFIDPLRRYYMQWSMVQTLQTRTDRPVDAQVPKSIKIIS